jgi:hypothetical protein
MSSYYRSYPDPVWNILRERSSKTRQFFDDLREHLLNEYNCNLTMFVEDTMQRTAQQMLDDDDLMMMASSGRSPQAIVNDLFAEAHQLRTQKTVLGGVI